MQDVLFMVGALFIIGGVVAGIMWLITRRPPPQEEPEADDDDREADI